MVQAKPYLRFHVDEMRFDGTDWQIAFTPRGIQWESKRTMPVPDAEMRKIWKAEGIPVVLDEANAKLYWKQVEGGVRDFLIREYWTLGETK